MKISNISVALLSASLAAALLGCGGSGAASAEKTVTLVKALDYVVCSNPNPVPDEVALIQATGIHPVLRNCINPGNVAEVASIPKCGEQRYFSHSVLEVLPAEVALAKKIGYGEPDTQSGDWSPSHYVECN